MKNLLILVFLTISLNVLAQDVEMLGYINQYRVAHGKSVLIISDTLMKLANIQLNIMVKQDSTSHSKLSYKIVTGEIVTGASGLSITPKFKIGFNNFLKRYFKLSYIEIKTDADVIKYTKLCAIYNYNNSPHHKVILLGNFKYVGFGMDIKKNTKFYSIINFK